MLQAVSAETVNQASDEIAQILRSRHRTAIGADDFTIFSQQDFVTPPKPSPVCLPFSLVVSQPFLCWLAALGL